MTMSASAAVDVTFPVAPDFTGLGPRQAIEWNIVAWSTKRYDGRFSVVEPVGQPVMRFRALRIPERLNANGNLVLQNFLE